VTVTHLTGQVLDVIRTLPDGSVDAAIGSPPFLALRDYNGQPGQWGSEASPAEFLANLLDLSAELRRVLAPHGSLALELGDTYSGSGGGGGDYRPGGLREGQVGFAGSQAARRRGAEHWRQKQVARTEWPLAKSMCLTPTTFAACLSYGRNLLTEPMTAAEALDWVDQLRAGGMSAEAALAAVGGWVVEHGDAHRFDPWRVRNLIVWARNNPPVGALGDKVRPATSYITVACMSDRRWFDLDAVRSENPRVAETQAQHRRQPCRGGERETNDIIRQNPAGAPPLDHWWDEPDPDLVWLVNTQGSSLAHYAMWPPKLAERLILAMVPERVCRTCGEPSRRITGPAEYRRTDSDRVPARLAMRDGSRPAAGANQHTRPNGANTSVTRHAPTIGWSDCGHDDWRPGVVLDPFAGAGTTLAVADIHGRDAIGIDLDPSNRALYEPRYEQCWKALGRTDTSPVTEHGEQLGLLDGVAS